MECGLMTKRKQVLGTAHILGLHWKHAVLQFATSAAVV